MKPRVSLNEKTPIGRLVSLLSAFDRAYCDGEPLKAAVEQANDIAEEDVKIIVAAQRAITSSLAESDYGFARLAYQVLDFKLKTVVEPTLTPDIVTSLANETTLWECSNKSNVITKSQLVSIANAVNDVRNNDQIGTPEVPSDLDVDAVLEYGMQ